MKIDLHVKSQQLLEALANAIHDRELNKIEYFSFNLKEIHLTEKWLTEFCKELDLDK